MVESPYDSFTDRTWAAPDLRQLAERVVSAMATKGTTSESPDRAGRFLVWFPMSMLSIWAAGWSADRWPVSLSDDAYQWVFVAACTIVFPTVLMSDGIKRFRELRGTGVGLILVGLFIMSLHGLAPAMGFTMDERLSGVSFFAYLLGLIWLTLYWAAIGATTAWVHVCKGQRH